MSCCRQSRIRRKKITELPPATEAALDDLFETIQYDSTSGTFINKKQTVQILADLLATVIGGEGGGTANLDGEVDPEGVVTADKNVWYRNNATDGYFWKTTDGGNTGWQPVL